MAQKKLAEPTRFQLSMEKGLFIAAWILGTSHTLLSVFRYAVNYESFRSYEQWYAVILIVVVMGYLLITKIRFPRTIYRVKAFFCSIKSWEQAFLIALLFWFVVVCTVRQKTDQFRYFKFGDWWLFDTVILSLILFPMGHCAEREKSWRAVNATMHIVALSYTIFVGWCLWNVFHLNILTLPSGTQIGMTRRFRLSLGAHVDITGAISFAVFAVSCHMIVTKKPVLKVIYSLAALLQLYVCFLSNSRTVFVSVLFLLSVSAFFAGWYLFRERKLEVRLILCIGATAAVAILIWWLRSESFVWFDAVTDFSARISKNAEQTTVITGETAARELTSLNGRIKIWKAAVKVMFSSPLAFFFGVTPFSVTEALNQIGGLSSPIIAHAHNQILQIGVSFGVPAMIAFIVFIIRILLRCVQNLLKTDNWNYKNLLIGNVSVLALVLMNMAEAYLVVYFSIISCIFFLFCGLVTDLSSRQLSPET